jgi:hypothetical protein
MAPSLQDVAGLKDLVSQLQDRIEKIERSMKGGEAETTADRIRMILMGPPGAGTSSTVSLHLQLDHDALLLVMTDLG